MGDFSPIFYPYKHSFFFFFSLRGEDEVKRRKASKREGEREGREKT